MTQDQSIQLSIVVPCYRSGARLHLLVERIEKAIEALSLSYEIILVHDASGMDTWKQIQALSDVHKSVRGIDLLFNVGQFRATLCGMEHACGEWVATMDDDLQHPPEELPKLIEALRADPGVDCVMGAYHKKQHSRLRNWGSALMARMNAFLYDSPRRLQRSSFRVMRRPVVEALCAHTTAKPIIGSMLLQTTRRIVNVEVEHEARADGRSGYGVLRLVRIFLDNLISCSTLPLKVVSGLGLLAAMGSIGLGAFYALRYWLGAIRAPGFATIVLLVTFFGGMTLLSIGIMGEYVIRVIQEVSRPPRYHVRSDTRKGSTADES